MTGLPAAATLLTAVGCGLSAGALAAFSTFVMPALDRLDPAASITAMQEVNRAAVTPAFMTLLLSSSAACGGLVVLGLARRGAPESPWLIAGGALFVVGVFGVTVVRNVPLNDALATADPLASDAAARWAAYARDWALANHVRSVAGAVATGLLVLGHAAS
jgi:uncharacterized membrane protein